MQVKDMPSHAAIILHEKILHLQTSISSHVYTIVANDIQDMKYRYERTRGVLMHQRFAA